ncbi:AAA family ATPase [Microbacterium sediminicola]|uniref:AAA family ATPase n=1 Tax=Microbacterium sediminicola TaxID=415210 RepID=A0ABP4TQ46_9MICO
MSSASSRSSDPVRSAIDSARAEVLAQAAPFAPAPVIVLIDGRSGAGKSTLADALVQSWPVGGDVQLLRLDSLYPGWDGLDDGVGIVRDGVLAPLARGEDGTWPRWDWAASRPAEIHRVDAARSLIVEGSGILTPQTAPFAQVRVWMESPLESRRERALARDGETYRPHWERWAQQEDRHLERDDPPASATLVWAIP